MTNDYLGVREFKSRWLAVLIHKVTSVVEGHVCGPVDLGIECLGDYELMNNMVHSHPSNYVAGEC